MSDDGGLYNVINMAKNELKEQLNNNFIDSEDPEYIYDPFGDCHCTKKQRNKVIRETKSIIKKLEDCSKRTKELESFINGDHSIETYLELLEEFNV